MKSEKYLRKPFAVDAIQVTADNMDEVAKWCQGDIRNDERGTKFVKVRVHNPLTPRQTQAFVGDWVLYAGKGYKVYTNKAFLDSFIKDEQTTVVTNVFINEPPKPGPAIHGGGNNTFASGS